MALTPLFTIAELASYCQQPIDTASGTLAQTLATGLVIDKTGPLGTLTDAQAAIAKGVALSAAARMFTNPENVVSETVGPYSVARPKGGVYLTVGERNALKSITGSGAFTINTIDPNATPYVPWYDRNYPGYTVTP